MSMNHQSNRTPSRPASAGDNAGFRNKSRFQQRREGVGQPDPNDPSASSRFTVNPHKDIFCHEVGGRSELWRWREKLLVLSPRDLFWPLDLSAEWRRHLIWSKKDDGRVLIEVVTSRFASTLTFLSLLFSAEVATYFSPSGIATEVRASLRQGPGLAENRLTYAAGITLIISIIVTASAILANYSALLLFKSVDPANASVVLRSDVGVYSAQLPSRLTVLSIYLFLSWLVLFWWYNLDSFAALALGLATILSIVHVVTTFSLLGRIIATSSAMGPTPIMPKDQEEELTPKDLSDVLLAEARIHRKLQIPINKQYITNSHANGSDCSYHVSLLRRYPGIHLEDYFEDAVENGSEEQ